MAKGEGGGEGGKQEVKAKYSNAYGLCLPDNAVTVWPTSVCVVDTDLCQKHDKGNHKQNNLKND